MEPDPSDAPARQQSVATSSDPSNEPAKPLARRLAEIALIAGGVIGLLALALAGMSHLSDVERCGWAGAEFALESHATWSNGCQLEMEGQWVGELVIREKMRRAEGEIEKRRTALMMEIQDARAQGRAEDSKDPEIARQAKARIDELKAIDEARGTRRDQAGEERGALARRELLFAYVKRERGK